jgi:hypothetical protein
MIKSIAVILPEYKDLEEAYDEVINQDDLYEFEYQIENSTLFKNTYTPFLKAYVQWFFNKKKKSDIEKILGFKPISSACRTYFSNISPIFTVKAREYKEKIECKFSPKYTVPESFIVNTEYYDNTTTGIFTASCSYTEYEYKNKAISGLKKKRIRGDYNTLIEEHLLNNSDRLVVVCSKI